MVGLGWVAEAKSILSTIKSSVGEFGAAEIMDPTDMKDIVIKAFAGGNLVWAKYVCTIYGE